MIEYALSFSAGFLTAISPCVLPVLPLILGSAAAEHRYAPLALVAGMMGSFIIIGVSLASFGNAAGVSDDAVRIVAASLLVIVGLVLLIPFLQSGAERALQPISNYTNGVLGTKKLSGLHGQFLFGTLLGAIWSPCVGPTLGAAIGLASQSGAVKSAVVMTFYSLGAAVPLVALAYGSKKLLPANRVYIAKFAKLAKPVFGFVIVTIGIAILIGTDKAIETSMLRALPQAWIDFITRY